MAQFRSLTVTNTGTSVKGTGANVTTINIVNRHSAVIYVKFYNSPIATFQDVPILTLSVAASGGIINQRETSIVDPVLSTTLGLYVRVTTGAADNDNTAAATLPIIELEFN